MQNCIDLSWLPFLSQPIPEEADTPQKVAFFELKQGLTTLGESTNVRLALDSAMGEGYRIEPNGDEMVISGGETGLLYGAYQLLMARACGEKSDTNGCQPRYALRMLNCWDNMSGDIERGYAGRSLFFDKGEFCYDRARIMQLGRMLASVGINVLCINNVNVVHPAEELIGRFLPQTAELAAILRRFGVRLMLSVDYAMPTYGELDTADPLDEGVADFWRCKAEEIYRVIPDFVGFLVKADSEHRPGPFTYGRNHVQGANVLARALQPHGGIVIWRCFVYNCRQDWRDHTVDRPKAAYDTYAPLDGQFCDNVILQIKNGPYDFQVREPLSPLLLAMPRTAKALEVQLAQEYTGHQIDLYAMAGMWNELWQQLPQENLAAVAAVSNLGNDANWTGHPFAQFNLFAYGRMAWRPERDFEREVRTWCRLSYALEEAGETTLTRLLMYSREAYEQYTGTLGLCWMVNPNHHYGPSPEGYEYALWGTYHRADRDAVGIDRTDKGTGYTRQYPRELCALYEDTATCPEDLMLFFHRVRYDTRMRDGRTLIQRIYDDHFEGADKVETMAAELRTLEGKLPPAVYQQAEERMERQKANAREWRDVTNTFFHRLSGVADEKGRTIYD